VYSVSAWFMVRPDKAHVVIANNSVIKSRIQSKRIQ